MFAKRVAGVLLAGGVLVGCQSHSTPKASVDVQPVSPSTVADSEQSWRASHPGALVGHVNAVDVSRRVVSVAGIPADQVQIGDVISIIPTGQSSNPIEARVYAKQYGWIQLDYGGLDAGQGTPREGDLAVRYPGGVAVPPPLNEVTVPPATQPGVANPAVVPPPPTPAPAPAPGTSPPAPTTPPPPPETTPPPTPTPPPPATTPTTPPATPPAPSETTPPPTPPTTPPAPPAPGTETPPAPSTPPAPGAGAPPAPSTPPPAPDQKPPTDLNK